MRGGLELLRWATIAVTAVALSACTLVYDSEAYREPLVDAGAASKSDRDDGARCGDGICQEYESRHSCRTDCASGKDEDDDD